MANYIFQIVLFQLLFLAVYQLWLRKETFFNYNRWYLLGTSILSLVLPFVKIQFFKQVIPQQMIAQLPAIFIGGNATNIVDMSPESNPITTATTDFTINYLHIWVIGMCIAAVYFMFKLHKLYHLQQTNRQLKQEGYVLVQLENSTDAFSFFKHIFLGDLLTQNQQTDILKHEKTHVQQWHSADLIWFEFLRIIFWFNPLVYLFQQQITEVHEFIADKTVAKNKTQYYKNLLSQAFGVQQLSIINQFYSSSLIKKRIIMLNKQQSTSKKLVKYLSIIPLVIGMLFYVSCNEEELNKVSDTENIVNENSNLSEDSFSLIERKIEYKNTSDAKNINWMKLEESFTVKPKMKYDSLFLLIEDHEKSKFIKLSGTSSDLNDIIATAKGIVYGKYYNKKSNVKYIEITEIFEEKLIAPEVPFTVVDKSPVFPGCDETTSTEILKKCFQESVTDVVSKNFNTKLAKTANLTGRQKVLVMFKIDKTGNITDVRARTPHPSLKAEAERVIKLLPLMKAGEYKGQSVTVPYSLPIIFEVN